MSMTRIYQSIRSRLPDPRPALSQCSTTIRESCSRLAHSRAPLITAGILFVTASEILDFVCKQKINNDAVDWNYYIDAPTRLVYLIIISSFMGYQTAQVVKELYKETQQAAEDTDPEIKPISAKKILANCTLFNSAWYFAEKTLNSNVPVHLDNFGYLFASTLVNGMERGILMSSATYWLKKLNFTIRPLTTKHAKYIALGILVRGMTGIIDYISKQMIDRAEVDWSPADRVIVWEILSSLLGGTLYGFAAVSFEKYRTTARSNPEGIRKLANFCVFSSAVTGPLAAFAELAMKTPIDRHNAGYITLDALTNIPASMFLGANLFVLVKLRLLPEPEEERLNLPAPESEAVSEVSLMRVQR